ncbi:zinc carboxypeptidase A 1-like [Uranotaenia lowii]|uniref:zinc carboxypeptidase A 1-like n=1 Tax=Uranotaenia lowii TaxID=190385 RepID=UPI00247875E7|nr:zinc carboxypeptidase A 1-like [Uranotaenia lowii]
MQLVLLGTELSLKRMIVAALFDRSPWAVWQNLTQNKGSRKSRNALREKLIPAMKRPYAFSEEETRSLSNFIASISGKLRAYIAFHSYSQILLFPYGHTSEHTPNHDDLNDIAKATVQSLAKRYGTKYTYGNIYDAIYPASGASCDWAYGTLDIKIAYTYELRPNKNSWNGFVLAPRYIIPTGEETLDSLVTMIEESERRGYYQNLRTQVDSISH